MKKILYLSLVLFVSASINAQSLSPTVIASAGGYFTSANASLSWTLGEPMTQTFSNANNILTQGFQQPSVNLILLNLKAYFEGFYSSGGQMNNSGSGGCLFFTGISPNSNDVDTVTVSAITPGLVVADTKKGIIHLDGTVSISFGSSVLVGSSYYIRVRHRNSIETWSASPVLMAASVTYDFTNFQTKAYGNNMIQIDANKWAFYSGDISDNNNLGLGLGYQDGVVEGQDYTDMENGVSSVLTGYIPQDITGDGVCESADYTIMENNVTALRFTIHP